ncbi:MAG: hemin uptake protein HemP [Blastopirellula sp. JB062]
MPTDEPQKSNVDNHASANDADANQPPAAGPNAKIVDSDSLMAGNSEILISHKGAFYRLRETRSGKLILQK